MNATEKNVVDRLAPQGSVMGLTTLNISHDVLELNQRSVPHIPRRPSTGRGKKRK